jgi:hypothetical protein
MSDKSVKTKQAKTQVDWEAIERSFRSGLHTLREIASRHPGTNHVAIARRAKKEGWQQNLQARIQAKAEELVTRADVTGGVTNNPVTEAQIVDAGAEKVAAVLINQRKNIARLMTIAAMQMDELEASSGVEQAACLRELGDRLRNEDDNGRDRLNDVYHAIISLPERSKTAKQLADTLRIAIELERKAYKMDEVRTGDDPLTALIKRINSGVGSAFRPVAVDPAYSDEDGE